MQRLIAWLKSLFQRTTAAPIGHNQPPPPDVSRETPARVKTERPAHDYGTLYYLDDLLERLDDYHAMAKQLKRVDSESYKTYTKLGATIAGKRSQFIPEMPASWRDPKLRPATGMMHVSLNDSRDNIKADLLSVEFCYFSKLDRKWQPNVQATNGDIYRVSYLYSDMKHGRKIRLAGEFFAGVLADASVQVLLEYRKHWKTVGKGRRRGDIPQPRWETPIYLQIIAADWRNRGINRDCTPQGVAHFMFSWLANVIEGAGGGFQVRATRNGIACVFGIEMKRSSYFFRERDPVVIDGITKKIFHFVRPFDRTLPDGRLITVRAHFRGLREFDWHGHHVVITMPGLHHKSLNEFHAEIVELEPDEIMPANSIDRHIAAASMAKHMERPIANDMKALTNGQTPPTTSGL